MNYQSIPRRFNKPTSNINLSYIDASLREKQNTIDQNFGLLTDTIEKTLGQDLIRPEDREMLKQKVSSVLNTLDNTDSIQFDSKKSRYTITDALSEAARDPEVLKQVANTQNIRKIQKFHQERLEKGNLSNTNFNDAWIMSGANEYLSGEKNDMGQFQYLEYRDVSKNLIEKAKDYKELFPDREVPIRNGAGDIEYKTFGALSKAEWQQVLPSLLDEQDRAQLAINGRVRFKYNDEYAVQTLEQERDMLTADNTNKITALQRELTNGLDDVNKEKAKNQIALYQNSNIEVKNRYEKLLGSTGTAGSIGGYMMERELVSGMSNMLGFEPYLSDIKVDQSYWKAREEAEKATGKTIDASTGFLDTNNDGVPDATSIAIPEGIEDYLGQEEIFQRELNYQENTIASTANQIYNGIKDENVKAEVEQYKQDLMASGMNETAALRQTVLHFADKEDPIMTLKQKETMISAIDASTSMYKKLSNSANEADQEIIDVGKSTLFQQLYNDNPNIQMLGTGKSFKQVMAEKGIDSEDKLQTFLNGDSKEAKLFKANMAAQTIDLGIVGDSTYSNDFTTATDYKLRSIKRVAGLIGEDVDATEVYIDQVGPNGLTYVKKPLSQVKEGERISFIGEGDSVEQSRLTKFLTDAEKLKSTGFTDHSMYNDGELMDLLGEDNYKEIFKRKLDVQSAYISGANMINIQPSYGEKNKSKLAIEVSALLGGTSAINDKQAMSLIKLDDDRYQVIQQGYTTEYEEGSDEKGKKFRKVGIIKLSDIKNQQNSDLMRYIEFEKNRTNIDFNIDREVSLGKISYPKPTVKTERALAEYYGPNSPNRLRASKNYVENVIEKNPALKGDFSNFAKDVIKNSNKFEAKFESSGGYAAINVYMQGMEDPIYTATTADETLAQDIYKIAVTTPQVYLTMAIEDMAIRYQTGDVSKINAVEKLLEK